MALSLGDMVTIGLRLIQNRKEVGELIRKIFGGTGLAGELVQNSVSGRSMLTDERGASHQYDTTWVQMALNHLLHDKGIRLTVDGKLGDETRKAIETYQLGRGLEVDGWLGPVTMATLEADIRQAHARAGRQDSG